MEGTDPAAEPVREGFFETEAAEPLRPGAADRENAALLFHSCKPSFWNDRDFICRVDPAHGSRIYAFRDHPGTLRGRGAGVCLSAVFFTFYGFREGIVRDPALPVRNLGAALWDRRGTDGCGQEEGSKG